MNNHMQPYKYLQRLEEGANGTGIKASYLAYTWRVEMNQKRGGIRKKDTIIEGHLRIYRKKKDYRIENCNYNQV